jgi:hypothetical protein
MLNYWKEKQKTHSSDTQKKYNKQYKKEEETEVNTDTFGKSVLRTHEQERV